MLAPRAKRPGPRRGRGAASPARPCLGFIWPLGSGCRFRGPQRLADQRLGQNQPRLGDVVQRQHGSRGFAGLGVVAIEGHQRSLRLALDVADQTAEPFAAADADYSSRSALPAPRRGGNPRRARAAGRSPARKSQDDRRFSPALRRRGPATGPRLTISQSSIFIDPSGRSAMICTVVPACAESLTRTSR